MIIVLRFDASEEQYKQLVDKIESQGLRVHVSKGTERTIIGAIGDERILQNLSIDAMPGVENVLPILKPYKLASRDFHPEKSKIQVRDVVIGGDEVIVAGGPCSVETGDSLLKTAMAVKAAGGKMLRAGAFKPRTSPYDFQGLGEDGLKILDEARSATGLPFITEVMETRTVELVYQYADVLQIGARNTQNYNLLKEVGQTDKPVLLKRGMSVSIKEFMLAAEYILSEGNQKVILCERGIRTFETATRNTLDIASVAVLHYETHLPVWIDPSHAAGNWRWVTPLARAAVAIGADGLIVEVHVKPENAWSDGAQTLRPDKFSNLMAEIRKVAEAIGRTVAPGESA
ncbi:MAG TPA: 3-deoxy-7-phosphoheptulonate synthase [Candidatus Sumerlaeota bacterium]|nr:3-deoxy-7-phosphoheptulonate synthase [Candidatus Sumerlaeota bacterium]